MSYSFYVRVPAAPTLGALAKLVDDSRWTCNDAPANDGPIAGTFPHVYLRGHAARGVELSYEDGAFGARILTCSSRADHELAIRIVSALARQHRAPITPEDRDAPIGLEAFAAEFGAAWIAGQLAWAAPLIARMVDEEGKTSVLSGVRRPFHLGPRFLGELRARGGDLAEQLMAAFIALQEVDEERYYVSGLIRVGPKTGDGGFTVAAWAQDCGYLFPVADRFAILDGDGTVDVLHAHGPEVAGARWQWLDEEYALVEAVTPAEWPALVARARRVAIPKGT